MILIDKISCADTLEARKHERHLIEILGATLISSIPSRSKSEYQKHYKQNNKDATKTKGIQYRRDNYDMINDKCVCSCGGSYTYKHKSTHLKTQKHQTFIKSITAEDAFATEMLNMSQEEIKE